ncbi:MAG: hypothetical protein ABFD92_03325 [Planctomycetaceae bacterium]|nr:hypothetical protein [Planctomycetaceae bacterium]
MAGENYFLISALPDLGRIGTAPPMTPAALIEHVSDRPQARQALETLFLADDLLQRASILSGQQAAAEPIVLTQAQVHDRQPLPDFLAPHADATTPRATEEAIWEAYFRHAAAVATQLGSEFLAQWVAHEVAMRNALAAARAQALGLEAQPYLVAGDLSEASGFDALIGDWKAAPTPLAADEVLDRHRWDWISSHDAWFTFDDDELVAYGARLGLLVRWDRIRRREKAQPA